MRLCLHVFTNSMLVTNDHTFDTERPFIKHISISVDVDKFDQTHACLQNAVSKYCFSVKENNICNEVSIMCGNK